MVRKDSVSRELVADVMRRLMAEMEKPSPLESLPDVDCDMSDIDALVDRLLTAALPECKTPSLAPKVDAGSGSKAVSLRIPYRVIHAFKSQSIKTGANYQTLMNRALAEAAENFAL